MVQENWTLTSNYRLKHNYLSSGTIQEYFDELKRPAGYHLLLEDFKTLYEGKSEAFFNNIVLLREKIIRLAKEKANNTRLNSILSMVTNLTKDLQTEHKRLQHFTNLGTYISPIEVVVGQQMEQKRTRMGLSYMPTDCTMQVIALNLVLERFFSLPDVLKDTLSYIDSLISSTSGAVHNLIQGSVWSKMSASFATNDGKELLLPLIQYYDDFEIGNPLGSHAGLHKLGAIYISCPCLPPNYVSKLNNIFLLAIFHATDRINFGNRIIFKKVIEQLNFLCKYNRNTCEDRQF